MPNFAAKYSSEYLTPDQVASALTALPAVLNELFGECTFTVCYGWAANIHVDLWHVPMRVQTMVLPYFIEDSIRQQIIVPGQSDLIVRSPNNELNILFCHECDIHVDGESPEFMQRFIAAEQFSKIKFFSQEELKALYPDQQKEGSFDQKRDATE